MSDPLISLTTDFGDESPYVAAMKGVILSLQPSARLIDLSHDIPAQDIAYTAYFLRQCVPYFPSGTLHVIVVDPGVGTDRALLYVEVQRQRLLVPDNGCWTTLLRSDAPLLIRLTEPKYWQQAVSFTFHGRDILAPVAGHIARGLDPRSLGPMVTEYVRWQEPPPIVEPHQLVGQVVFIDHFGNLISNIPADAFRMLSAQPIRIHVGQHEVVRQVRSYAEARRGDLVALISSSDRLEIAVVQGNAARQLGAGVGSPCASRQPLQ